MTVILYKLIWISIIGLQLRMLDDDDNFIYTKIMSIQEKWVVKFRN